MRATIERQTERIFGMNNVATEYRKLRSVITGEFDERVWFMTDACLSVIASLMLKDLPNPIGLNLVDGPSSEKTTVLSFFYGLPIVYRSDDFTPASFVSQAANVSGKKLEKVDLLPKIRYKCLVVPELAPVFGAERDDLIRNFSMLTRVFDGQGLKRDGAVHGGRGYEGDYHFTWLGATTPIKQQVWNVMGALGSRFLFLTVDKANDHDALVQEAFSAMIGKRSYTEKVQTCRTAVKEFFSFVSDEHNANQFHRSVLWEARANDTKLLGSIARLAALTVRIRSTLLTWGADNDSDEGGSHKTASVEGPNRLASVLHGLARGHSIVNGRSRLSEEDLPLIVAVALSSIPDDRRHVLELAIDPDHPAKTGGGGTITSSEIEAALGYSRSFARKTLRELATLGLGELSGGSGGPSPLRFTMGEKYSWLWSADFLGYIASVRTLSSSSGANFDQPF